MNVSVEIQTTNVDGVVIISFKGRLDGSVASFLREEIDRISSQEIKSVIFDLADTDFMDSSGLALVVSAYKRMRSYGGMLVLVNLSKNVRYLMELSRLDRVFMICDNQEQALEKFSDV